MGIEIRRYQALSGTNIAPTITMEAIFNGESVIHTATGGDISEAIRKAISDISRGQIDFNSEKYYVVMSRDGNHRGVAASVTYFNSGIGNIPSSVQGGGQGTDIFDALVHAYESIANKLFESSATSQKS